MSVFWRLNCSWSIKHHAFWRSKRSWRIWLKLPIYRLPLLIRELTVKESASSLISKASPVLFSEPKLSPGDCGKPPLKLEGKEQVAANQTCMESGNQIRHAIVSC